MHNRFETLLKRCKARKRKILMKRLAVMTLLAGAVAAGLFLTKPDGSLFGIGQMEPQISGVATPEVSKRSEAPKPKPQERAAPPSVQKRPAKQPPAAAPERAAPPVSSRPPETKPAPERTPPEPRTSAERERNDEVSKEVPKKPIPLPAVQSGEIEESGKGSLLEVKDVTNLDALLEQYGNAPRYAVALKIAESYYRDGDFENASLWARKANLLDRDDERAWIVYAKSEYALGHEKRAIRILRLFLDYKDSAKARSLLMTWSRP
ncbi:hypothetical protein [Hydrogenimonas sp.]